MSSIASSRRGRPNTARDSHYVQVTGDFQQVIENWMRIEGVGREAVEYRLELVCVRGGESGTHWGWNDYATLNDFFILSEVNVRRGEVPIYKMSLVGAEADCERTILLRHIIIPADAEEPVDVCQCREATPEEIAAALDPREA